MLCPALTVQTLFYSLAVVGEAEPGGLAEGHHQQHHCQDQPGRPGTMLYRLCGRAVDPDPHAWVRIQFRISIRNSDPDINPGEKN